MGRHKNPISSLGKCVLSCYWILTQFWWFSRQIWRRFCAVWHCLRLVLLPWLEQWYCTASTWSGQTHDRRHRAAAWFECLHIIPLSGSLRYFRWQSSSANIFPRQRRFLFSSIPSESTSRSSAFTLIKVNSKWQAAEKNFEVCSKFSGLPIPLKPKEKTIILYTLQYRSMKGVAIKMMMSDRERFW